MGQQIKKKIRFSVRNPCEWNGDVRCQVLLPNKFTQAVGPFVRFEYIHSHAPAPDESISNWLRSNGKNAHRGIAILTYIIAGSVEHIDSIGNHEKLGSGSVHWTKAGKGVLYKETISSEIETSAEMVSIARFWVNLPSKHKVDTPIYHALKSDEIPKKTLGDDAGWIKVISGDYPDHNTKIACYSKDFLYHIHLKVNQQFTTVVDTALEYAAFLPAKAAIVNGKTLEAGEFIALTALGEIIELKNVSKTPIDIFLFGGQQYQEPIVAEGNFVMNSPHEITQAYNDYYDGKYGQIIPQPKINK